ncbi:hypothetical protein J6590_000574 [Homalodisca vitripennis]|nr:hypothetical protein J6590_000574 [Homalodisca vitripennis]
MGTALAVSQEQENAADTTVIRSKNDYQIVYGNKQVKVVLVFTSAQVQQDGMQGQRISHLSTVTSEGYGFVTLTVFTSASNHI